MKRYKTLGVIPARYASTRFPGKPLKLLRGRPIIEWVWRQAKKAKSLEDVWVATDDDRIARAALAFGARVAMTSAECATGSDRIAEALADVNVEIVANIQGDEPQIDPRVIDAAVAALQRNRKASVATACVRLRRREDFLSPNVVKVVRDGEGRALYFSRSPIPSLARATDDGPADGLPVAAYKHIGFYVYRKDALLAFRQMPQTPLEQVEKLEQLRYLENGHTIVVVEAQRDMMGVDTPEELERLQQIFDPEMDP
ncbi:MAG: 3-deoxy-manno-octulosonate cytidylyltransferase [Candidatus Sumerlaeota bacterium]|nr:3-deoxy-manno-octulosonate cytidylyltransferase [Candidatus Sumerlaeota bacterium]